MENVFLNSWACKIKRYVTATSRECRNHTDIYTVRQILKLQSTFTVLSPSILKCQVSALNGQTPEDKK